MWMIWFQSFYRAAVNGATIGKQDRARKKAGPLVLCSVFEALAAILGRLFLLIAFSNTVCGSNHPLLCSAGEQGRRIQFS